MWIVIVAAILVLLLVSWRLLRIRLQADPSRPVDSGHPHLTDVDPHDA